MRTLWCEISNKSERQETGEMKKEIKSKINSKGQESRCALKIGFIFINYLELHATSSGFLLISYSSGFTAKLRREKTH